MTNRAIISMPEDIKNAQGVKGPICNKCSGFGFTYTLDGNKLVCKECHETGVGVNVVDLQRQVIELTRLVKMLYAELKNKGLTNIE
jgi:hypothetical protein